MKDIREVNKGTLAWGVGLLCFGAFLGGWAIAAGQGLITIACLCEIGFTKRERKQVSLEDSDKGGRALWLFRPWGSIPLSVLLLGGLSLAYLISIIFVVEGVDTKLSSLRKLRYLLLPIAILTLAPCANLFQTCGRRLLRVGIAALIASIVLASTSGLIGHFTGYNPLILGEQPYPGRNGGVYSMVMTYAYGLGIALLPLFVIAVNPAMLRQWFPGWQYRAAQVGLWLALVVGTVGLYFSYTRGGVLGLLSGGVVYLILSKRWKILGLFAFLGAVVILIAFTSESRYTSVDRPTRMKLTSHTERYAQWKAAIGLILENPVMGVGVGQFSPHCVDYKIRHEMPKDHIRVVDGEPHLTWLKSHAHNNFLEHFATIGILGGLIFIAFVVTWCQEATRNEQLCQIFLPPLISFIVGGMFENTFFDSEVLTIVMLLYVSLQIARMEANREC